MADESWPEHRWCGDGSEHERHLWQGSVGGHTAPNPGVFDIYVCSGRPETESAANGPSPTPSETRQDRWLRESLVADLLQAVGATDGPNMPTAVRMHADRLARSILGEPGDDR